MDGRQDGGPHERTGGHAQEGQGPDEPERTIAPVTLEEQGSRGRGDRHEHPAAGRLDEPCRHQGLERGRGAGECRSHGERAECQYERPAYAPAVDESAGEGHNHDVDHQVAADDPRCGPEHPPVRRTEQLLGDVGDDRRQGNGRDHELEAGQEHADTHDREGDVRVSTAHRPSVSTSRAGLLTGADRRQ
jgi:hypothetical protein